MIIENERINKKRSAHSSLECAVACFRGTCCVGLPVADGSFARSKRDCFAKDGGHLTVLELVLRLAAGAGGGHEPALLRGDGLAVDALVAVLDVPGHIGGVMQRERDTAGFAVDVEGPNVTGNLRNDRHNNLRPFKGE